MTSLKLPPRFVLAIIGARWRMRQRRIIVPDELPHLLSHLLDGDEVPHSALGVYGLTVFAEVDMDQGDDDPTLTGPLDR